MDKNQLAQVHLRFAYLFSGLLALTIIAIFIGWRVTTTTIRIEEYRRFNEITDQANLWIKNRMLIYHSALYSAKAFIENTATISPDKWASFTNDLATAKQYPGISSFFYSKYIPKSQRGALETTMRRFYPDFTIRPATSSANFSSIIIMVNPIEGRETALGFDQASEAIRAKFLEEVRDTGQIKNSLPVNLVTTNQNGFVLAIPVYKKDTEPTSVEERRSTLDGFAMLAFRGTELFDAIFGIDDPFPNIDFEVYENGVQDDHTLLYDHDKTVQSRTFDPKGGYYKKTDLDFNNHKWVVIATAKKGFGLKDTERKLSYIPPISGGFFVILLLLIILRQLYLYRKLSVA